MESKEYYKEATTPGRTINNGVYGCKNSEWSDKLIGFAKKYKEKEVIISLKPIADWINTDFSDGISKKYKQAFKFDKAKFIQYGDHVELDYREENHYVYTGSQLFSQGITEQTITNLIIGTRSGELYQRNYTGVFQRNGCDVEFLPKNFNRMSTFTYADRTLALPNFYRAPHEDLTNIEDLLAPVRGQTHKLYKCTVDTETASLAIVVETKDKIVFNIMSLAGMFFIKELILNHCNLLNGEWGEYQADEMYRQIGKMILSKRKEAKRIVEHEIQTFTHELGIRYRDLKTLEIEEKKTDTGELIKEMMKKIEIQAEDDKMIQSIYLDDQGKFRAIIGPLEFIAYRSKKGSNYDSYQTREYFETHEKIEEVKKNLGMLMITLKESNPYVFTAHSPLRHPHVYDDGKICTGTGGSLYTKLVGKLEIIAAIKLSFALLKRYNPGSPVRTIETMDKFVWAEPSETITPPTTSKIIYQRKES